MSLTQTKRDWSGILVAIACIGLGGGVIYEANSFSQFAGIFPRTIAIILVLAASAYIVIAALGVSRVQQRASGTIWRPLALIADGALWAFLIPVLGFLLASIIGFLGAMILAKFDTWSARAWLSFITLGVVVVTVGYGLFKFVLNVPL